MTKPIDRVQILKQESTALGGDDADIDQFYVNMPLDPLEDAPEVRGVFIQPASGISDEQVYVTRDGSGNMIFCDVANPTEVRLLDLGSGNPGKLIFNSDGGLIYNSSGDVMLKVASS